MSKNRRVSKKMSVVANNALHFGAIVVFFFLMVILNLLASSSCSQLHKTIGEKERVLSRLEDDRMREATRWEKMTTPERLEMALLKHGLKMKMPHAGQTIRLTAGGKLYAEQYAVRRMRGHRNGEQAAQYKPTQTRAARGRVRTRQ